MKAPKRLILCLTLTLGMVWAIASCQQEENNHHLNSKSFGMPLHEMAEANDCFPCHQEIVRQWSHNGMADAAGHLAPNRLPAKPSKEWIASHIPGVTYKVAKNKQKEGHWEMQAQRQIFGLNNNKKTTQRSQEIIGRIGAGIRAMSVIAGESGRWFFGPLEFLTKHKINSISDKEIRLGNATRLLKDAISSFDKLYVSIDLDVVDPAFAPGVGNPEAVGITSRELFDMITSLENKKIVGSDVVELNPSFDNGSTSSLAAKMISTIIAMNIK